MVCQLAHDFDSTHLPKAANNEKDYGGTIIDSIEIDFTISPDSSVGRARH
jgi:hypothetical protein